MNRWVWKERLGNTVIRIFGRRFVEETQDNVILFFGLKIILNINYDFNAYNFKLIFNYR